MKNKKKIIIISVFALVLLAVFGFVISKKIIKSINKSVYPRKYSEEVTGACKEFGVSEPLVYSVIKAESNFNAEAKSKAGAVGLMQLMPDTYKDIARWLGEEADISKINDPKTNIRYGVYYLSKYLTIYGDTDVALCAYNAGPGNVAGWLNDTRYSDDGKTLKDIPFAETKKYVEKINGYIKKYEELYYS